MDTRTRDDTVTFSGSFLLRGVDRLLPAGVYRVVSDEELVEGLSFPVYRRVATMIFVPTASGTGVEMIAIDPADLRIAQTRDAEAFKEPS